MLNGHFRVSGKEISLPAVAGEQEDLPMGRGLLQPTEGGGAALVVEIGESVIQNDGDGFLRRQHQLADGQPGGEVELICGPGGPKAGCPGQWGPRRGGQ